jgi:hypothetical protein
MEWRRISISRDLWPISLAGADEDEVAAVGGHGEKLVGEGGGAGSGACRRLSLRSLTSSGLITWNETGQYNCMEADP